METEKPKKEKNKKSEIVEKILQRWWYALDDWPPRNYNYSGLLTRFRLRVVSQDDWSTEPLFDDRGLQKVMDVPGYPGVFISRKNVLIDLRPKHLCPSYKNLIKKPIEELKEILNIALKNQIIQLKSQPGYDKDLLKYLKKQLNLYKKQ